LVATVNPAAAAKAAAILINVDAAMSMALS
jgi:hypothetical protein